MNKKNAVKKPLDPMLERFRKPPDYAVDISVLGD